MSKFTDKLHRVYRSAAPAIGFRKPGAEAENPPLLIVANLTGASVSEVKVIAGSVDAGIISGESFNAKSFKRLVTALGDVPLGLTLGNTDQKGIDRLVDSGCDFVIFDLKTPIAAIRGKEIGKILEIEPSLDQGLVRAISSLQLPVDGVLVTGEGSSVTVERLLVCQRFADLLGKPLLVTLSSSVTSSEPSSLYEAGVNGLVLPEGLTSEAFAELKKAISSLPRTAKRGAKEAALLPRVSGGLGTEVEEEEEE